jgi:hypothetical protein
MFFKSKNNILRTDLDYTSYWKDNRKNVILILFLLLFKEIKRTLFFAILSYMLRTIQYLRTQSP